MFVNQTFNKNNTMYKKSILMILSLAFLLPITAQDIKLNAPNKNSGKPLMQALSERKSSR